MNSYQLDLSYGSQPPIRHAEFWHDDLGSVYLQVENYTYKVHSFFLLRDSTVFQEIFRLVNTPPSVEGRVENHPIHLNGTSKIELDCLLEYYYEGMKSSYNPTLQTYIHLLAISTHYNFSDLRAEAIAALTRLKDEPHGIPPIQKIQLALKFNLTHWFQSAYGEIVTSVDLLDLESAEQLPVPILLLLTRSRELYRAQENCVQGAPVRGAEEIVVGEFVRLGLDLSGRKLQDY